MGASTSWLAVKGKPREAVLQALGLGPGTAEEGWDTGLQGCEFPNGWYVVAARGYFHRVMSDGVLKRISAGCEAVAGGVETHVMASTATGWRDGRQIWRADHQSENGIEDLTTEGELPAVFAAIHEGLRAEQAAEGGPDCGVDFIFDVPVKLCRALTGYDYDESGPDEQWHSLIPVAKPSWLRRLLGR